MRHNRDLRDPRTFRLIGFGLRVEVVRRDSVSLGPKELSELNMIAFGALRRIELQRQRKDQRQKLPLFARRIAPIRVAALVASMSAPGATVQPWSGVIGAEGKLTGDGRLIDHEALTWATFPLPLRWVAADHGGHDGAVIVGRIDAVKRSGDGLIHASGVIDLGSPEGREAARLIGGGFLSGVSVDLDSTDTEPRTVKLTIGGGTATKAAAVTSSGRVRAATLVAIPAFDVARIALSGESGHDAQHDTSDPDCGCTPATILHAAPPRTLPTIDDFPTIDDMTTLAARTRAARPPK